MRGALLRLASRRLRRFGYEIEAIGQVSGQSLRRRLFAQLDRLGFTPTHIVDVGAQRGAWSRDARDAFPACAFTLIEPQRELRPALEAFCAETARCRVILAGAGSASGAAELTIDPGDPEGSSFAISAERAAQTGRERREVAIVTLADVCAESPFPDPELVKIDAEGYELEVLAGAGSLLGKTELFFCEIPFHDDRDGAGASFDSIVDTMAGHGYVPYDITDMIRRPGTGALALAEVAFARGDGPLRSSGAW
jgi:FkbM family methyltransferase